MKRSELKQIIREVIEESLSNDTEPTSGYKVEHEANPDKAIYLGNCVDVGYGRRKISTYLPDATTMAQVIVNPDELGDPGYAEDLKDNYIEITENEFLSKVSQAIGPKKAWTGPKSFYVWLATGEKTLANAHLFYIYNENQDIHYFYQNDDYLSRDKY